ncbi:hypothetical protein BJP46_15740 [Paenibacillus odorifer]|nr:hypothetical protein BJP46_15740 [Paenibacillus odorifer]
MAKVKRILTVLWRVVNTDVFVYTAIGLAAAAWLSHEGMPLNFVGTAIVVVSWPLLAFVAFMSWSGILA